MANASAKSAEKKVTHAIFVIDAHNTVSVNAPGVATREGSVMFANEQELAALAAEWPGVRLVEIFNRLPGVKPVTKFTNRKTAIRRIWNAIAKPSAAGAAPAQEPTKTDRIIAALKQPGGATLKALLELTGWQNHSIRGFISAHLVKKRGMRIRSFTRNGERVYRVR